MKETTVAKIDVSSKPIASNPGETSASRAARKPGEKTDIESTLAMIQGAEAHPLDVFFKPKRVALIGASETKESVGRAMLWNLLSSPFGGTLYPVNPKRSSVLGIKAYASVAALPEPPELAIIAVPAVGVPGIIRECADAGAKGAIIISAGFKESGPAGAELEAQALAEARRGHMRVVGPNCMGVMSPLSGLNATFASPIALPGSVAFISQSGALCSAILDWSLTENVGFSGFVSVGSMADVGWGDLIEYFGDDPHTRSIILYMETIGDPRAFLSVARQVALSKPIILLKGGKSEAAARAAASHTGAMTGSDEVLDAALRRCGVLRVNNISALFYMAEVLGKQPRPQGPRLAIVTNAGGPGVLATDTLMDVGGELAKLSPETIESLNGILPAHWSHNNPVDILGDASPERFGKALEIVSRDPGSDGLLVIFTCQAMSDATESARHLAAHAQHSSKPVLASFMGGAQVREGEAVLNRANIPTFSYPDTGVRAFNYMWRYSYNLRGLYETPSLVGDSVPSAGSPGARALIEKTRAAGRTILSEFESKQLLEAYGIPTVKTRAATSEDEAVKLASDTGFPVVLKLLSSTITHKSDVGGVQLNLTSDDAVRRAYREIEASVEAKAGPGNFQGVTVQRMLPVGGHELILGSTLDPQFGPVLLFGSGGRMVEIYNDHALGLPPLNTTLARRMMEQTKIYRALGGFRGAKPVDLARLEELLVRFSLLVVAERAIREIDINPLLVSGEEMLALDARVVLHPAGVSEDSLPRLAIRPYPGQYVSSWSLKDGTPVTIRPIRPEDEPMVVKFHQTLSRDSVYRRYFHMVSLDQRVAHERLIRACFIDYDREMGLVAERKNAQSGEPEVIAVGRWTKFAGGSDEQKGAEVALLVSDPYQHRGVGSEVLSRLISIARAEKVSRLAAAILPENSDMQEICKRLGFQLHQAPGDPTIQASIEL
jgi:acetyltransferase